MAMSKAAAAHRGGLVVLYLAWGATYPVMRVALRHMPPLTLLTFRCLIGALPLLALALWRRERMPSAREWLGSLLVGALVLGGGHGLTTYGVQHVSGGLAALLVSMVSVWLAVLSFGLLRESLSRTAVLGLLLGFGGVALVVGTAAHGLDATALGALLVSPVSWALGSVVSTRVQLPRGPVMASAAQLVVMTPVFAIASAATGEPATLGRDALSTTSIASLLFLAIAGYAVGFATYTWLLRELPFSVLGTYAYVNPLVAVALGAAWLHESLGSHALLGGGCILAGVAAVVLGTGRRAPRLEPPASPYGSRGADALEAASLSAVE
jgi:drug/metabolite transporter (DMT)-like permease